MGGALPGPTAPVAAVAPPAVTGWSGWSRLGRLSSAARAGLMLAIVLALSGATVAFIGWAGDEDPTPARAWFAPYVDTTLTPQHAFEDPDVNPSDTVVLGFVVSGRARDGAPRCSPSWGGAYTLDEAATAIDLDRRIARYRDRGGDVVVSFGGAANQELALGCEDQASLVRAYRSVVDRYESTVIDLDIEGPALDDVASVRRRAGAIATVQRQATQAGRQLEVWLTLPVAPSGMLDNAVGVIDAMLAADVDLGGVNLMTMDYGGARPSSMPMGEAVRRSLTASHRQLGDAYRRAGGPLDSTRLWAKLGATPMIGVNDVLADVFTRADGEALVTFAREHGLGRVSMWSANRDHPCPGGPNATAVSNTCSGLAQSALDFTRILDAVSGYELPTPPESTEVEEVVDDPARSPYPVWDARAVYEQGERVVRHRKVYVAKWWTQGDDPTAPVVNVHDSPWRLVGPVLASDRPPSTTTLPAGTYPAWDPARAYRKGERVLWKGLGYEARWYAQGVDPSAPPTADGPSPWRPLTDG